MVLIEQSFVMDDGSWIILCALCFAAFFIIQQMFDDTAAAIMFTPLLLTGGAVGQLLIRELGLQASHDKTINVVVGMASGIIVAAILAITVVWVCNRLRTN